MLRAESLEELRTFVQVVESGSLTAAARALGVRTNVVSRRLLRLEERLGATLALRTTRALGVTAAGQAYYARCVEVLSALELAERELRAAEGHGGPAELSGTYRVHVPGLIADLLSPTFNALLLGNPELALELHVRDQPADPVREGLDLALGIEVESDRLVVRALGPIAGFLVAAPSYLAAHGIPTRPSDLTTHQVLRFVYPGGLETTWTLTDDAGDEQVVPVRGRLSATDSRTLVRACVAGLGIGLMSPPVAGSYVDEGRLERVLPRHTTGTFTLYASYPPSRRSDAGLAALLGAMREGLALGPCARRSRRAGEAPLERRLGVEGPDHLAAQGEVTRHFHGRTLEAHAPLVERQPVEGRTTLRREGLELVERALLLEDLGVGLERVGRAENARAAAVGLLGGHGVRRGIGPEEVVRVAGGRRGPEREPMLLPLRRREAVHVRAKAACEECVAIDLEVVRRDGGRHLRLVPYEVDGLGGCDVLEHDSELREGRDEGREHGVDEDRLPVEDVDLRRRDLPMDQQRHVDALHGLEHVVDELHRGHAVGRVRRGVRWVELAGGEDALPETGLDLAGRDGVREVGGHERLEGHVLGERRDDALTVGSRLLHRRDRRLQVGHHDGARELAGREERDALQHVSVPQVNVPVVGSANHERVGHVPKPSRSMSRRASRKCRRENGVSCPAPHECHPAPLMSEPTSLRFYDTLTGDKLPFTGAEPGKAGIYVCGPTVYDYAHLGHARCYVVWDVLIRHLRASGLEVNYVRNITDIDDKILKRAGEKGIAPADLAEEFTEHFQVDMRRLGNLDPDVEPKVSEHLGEIIAMVETLIAKGHAYASEGDVYYAVESFPEYGKLSHRTLEALKSGASERLDAAQVSRKRHPADFALWKGGAGGWESPWGPGRPGWHIECSAMSTKHIGDTLDLHAGGLDLVFPHHENEIAQSEGATGKTYCRHWMHNGFVQVNGEKMGKSLGNFFTARVLFDRVEPEAVRLWTMTVHYRAPLNLDFEVDDAGNVTSFPQLEEAERRVEYLYETVRRLAALPPKRIVERPEAPPEGIARFATTLRAALDDDLNMPQGLAAMAELLRAINELAEKAKGKKGKVARAVVDAAREALGVLGTELGLGLQDPDAVLLRIRDRRAAARGVSGDEVETAIQARVDARAAKDFERADAIRAELIARGVELHDTPEGTRWTVPS